jgi:pre-mRNA-splicing factor CWC22
MAQRLCQLNRTYVEPFEKIFVDSYTTVHRFTTRCLNAVAG